MSFRKQLLLVLGVTMGLTTVFKSPINWCSEARRIRRHAGTLSSSYNNTEDYLINTPGCYIPAYTKNFTYKLITNTTYSCGERAIFIDQIDIDEVQFRIDNDKMFKYSKKADYTCCYRFATRTTAVGHEDTDLTYTNCIPFKDGTKIVLDQEVITVACSIYKTMTDKIPIYEDSYIILKKLKANNTKPQTGWNVILIGLDTMSRARVYDTLPQTTKYLQTYGWLDYRGYQKVDYNTFPNLISVLTGKKMSTIYHNCKSGLSKCADYFIWSKFKEAGYKTAFGEDYLSLPDTFSKFEGFKTPPTDHYMRPFFLTGETRNGPLICTKQKSSATHLLNYAHSFAEAYKDNMFFGMFWINSNCHSNLDNPSLLDTEMVDFFERIRNTDELNKNTFIIFFSDHGTRFGDMRIPVESYYDERLPMFFMWVPDSFRMQNEEAFYNLQLNQERLVTPYDVYVTLEGMLDLTNDSKSIVQSEACPKCTTLFKETSPYRKCADAGVNEKWCSCHNMTQVSDVDNGANQSIQLAVSHIQNMTKTIETIPCMTCKNMTLHKVLRSHTYRNDDRIYYVVGFEMSPDYTSFESVVLNTENQFNVLSTYTLSPYNTKGNCVRDPNNRPYCVCELIANCNDVSEPKH